MSLPRYPKYKDSGVEWLGRVPAHWEVLRLGLLGVCQGGAGFPDEHQGQADNEIPFFKVADISRAARDGALRESSHTVSSDTARLLRARVFPRSTIVFAKVGAALLLQRYRWLGQASCIDNNMMGLTLTARCLSPFMLHVLPLLDLSLIVNPGAVPSINEGQISSQRVAVPPLPEQTAIAAFLDRETVKIDALVAEQERLIELLKEKRQAVISHAVTKGLNPDVRMKDSGIEWLGQIPAHWTLRRLKHISPFITVGVVVNPSTFVADEGLPFIYGGDIREGVIDWNNSRRIDQVSSQANSKTLLKAGDLLTVRVGAPGVTAVVPKECEGGNCASVMLVRKGEYNSDWLCFVMNTRVVRFQVEVVQYGAAQEQFNISHAVNFWVPTPPREEQDDIAAVLARATVRLDELTAEAQKAIDFLQERRTALISAAVTGQIDVREAAGRAA